MLTVVKPSKSISIMPGTGTIYGYGSTISFGAVGPRRPCESVADLAEYPTISDSALRIGLTGDSTKRTWILS
jgi:hypothetical protein